MICKIISPVLLFSSIFVLGCTDGHSQENAVNHFKVTVQNATAGNLLSPYLVIVHKADTSLINIGAVSSPGLQQVAETGATDIYQAELAANNDIISVSKVAGMPLNAGEARDVLVDAQQSVVDSGAPVAVVEGKISYDRGLNPNGNAPEILRWGSIAADVTFFKL
ncbi:MAG: hypothetical protein EOP07_23865 [Proteobacteria bacterium]|nr:MAG: hypothetical protein EOP07_23865 [Pseudomonadota bacterium]